MHATAIVASANHALRNNKIQSEQMAARREHAFQELYDCHWKDVRNYVVWFLDGCRDVDDIVQDVFMKVYERLDDYDPTRPARPWLFRIASNVASNLVEKQTAQKRSVEDGHTVSLSRMSSEGDFIIDVPDHREASPENKVAQQEMSARLHTLVDDLPKREREVIRTLYFEGMTQRAAAEAFGISRATLREISNRGLERLCMKLSTEPAA